MFVSWCLWWLIPHANNFLLNAAAFAARILPSPIKQAIYKVKPLARWIRGGLNRAAPSGLVEVKVAGGDLAGYTILLDMQVDKDYWLGTYEPELQRAVRELVPAGTFIYDVGANIGYVSLLLAKAAGEGGESVRLRSAASQCRTTAPQREPQPDGEPGDGRRPGGHGEEWSSALPGACFRGNGQGGRVRGAGGQVRIQR